MIEMVPVLMITYNRLEFTKKALASLLESDADRIIIIDNGSTDGTQEYLLQFFANSRCQVGFNQTGPNTIAHAMNLFLELTRFANYVAKVDNDTIIPRDFISRMLPHMQKADIVQAKHAILKETNAHGFDSWVAGMPADGPLRYNHFVGGTGIIFKRSLVECIPETEWVLGGWRQFQRDNIQLRKAFATDVEIQLLDTDENGGNYSQYPDYYRQTKRLKDAH